MSLFESVRPSRRDVLKQSGLITAISAATAVSPMAMLAEPKKTATTAALDGLDTDNLFTRIGVKPILNARGTFTIITGSRSLPEVKQAMMEASHYYVHLDELMPAVGAEIAKLMGADAAVVTTGCEAGIALATVACIAGTDPEKSQSLPYVKGRNQIIIPKHSRNPYDFGVRMCGSEIVEVDSPEELRAKLTGKVAMIYVYSDPSTEKSSLPIGTVCSIAKEKGVPVFVDAAAEEPLVPNIHLAKGATFVGYSGGKCMRGPQAAGVILGQKDLIEAMWFNAAPHHNWGRAFKVGKEEIMGMLAAVRQWYKRDHDAEQRTWRSWLQHIESRVKTLPSVTTEYLEPEDLSNRSPRLRIHWDATQLKITGTELVELLDKGTPRILVDGGTGQRPEMMASSVTIMPYMMSPGEDKIVADAIYGGLTHPGHYENPAVPTGSPAQIAGNWAVKIQYTRGVGEQKFSLQQDGGKLSGTQTGELFKGTMKGKVQGQQVQIASSMQVSGNSVPWIFKGELKGSQLSGTVSMGEYGHATWSAIKA